jgi:hypothetical protein
LRQRHSRVPEYTASGDLILPKNFHEWIYVGSPLTPDALNDGKASFSYPAGFKIPKAKGVRLGRKRDHASQGGQGVARADCPLLQRQPMDDCEARKYGRFL